MKKVILQILCVIIIVFSITSCSNNNTDITITNTSYSYETKGEVVNGEYSKYDTEYLVKLNDDYKLDELVKDCKTDFEKVQAVTKWVSNLWQHDGMNVPKQNDPLFILDEITKNGERFRCVEYGTVISGCLLSLGITSRTIGLKMRDVETIEYGAGHVASEVYLKDLNKWIFVDGQWGIIPTLDGVPLNIVEFGQVLNKAPVGQKLGLIELSDIAPGAGTDDFKFNYYFWIKPYIYYCDTSYKIGEEKINVMLTPIGATNPKIFQITSKIEMDVYTDSASDFYLPPKQ